MYWPNFFLKVAQKTNLERFFVLFFFKLIKVHFWLFKKVYFYIFAILKKKIMRYDQNQKNVKRYIFCANLKKKIESIHALVQKICVAEKPSIVEIASRSLMLLTLYSPLNSGQLSAKADLKADLRRLQVSSKKLT